MNPDGQTRILLRQLKRRSRQPKRWDSLPCLQLPPANRPLFVCQRCKFSNFIAEVCPWCFGTCDTAALAAVVRRRVSSPTLLNNEQKMQLVRIERQARLHSAFLIKTSYPGPRATRVLPDGPPHLQGDGGDADMGCDDVRRRHRNVVLYSASDVVATATSDTTLQPFLDQIVAARLDKNRERERRSVPSSAATTSSARTKRASRPITPATPRTPSPLNPRTPTRMSSRNEDVTNTSEPASAASSPPSPSPSPSPLPVPSNSPTPCLRRKQRMHVIRQRSSCSLRRRATASSLGSLCRDSATSPPSSPRSKSPMSLTTTTTMVTSSRPESPRPKAPVIRFSTPPPGASPDTIPLGHPQRPLYTAIRKNMSRPESPSPPSTPNAAPTFDAAFQTLVYERQTRSLDIDAPRFASLSRASQLAMPSSILSTGASPTHSHTGSGGYVCARPSLFAATGTGFSVSGETELRMDLARSRSMDGVPSDFAFREVRPDGSVRAKVKSIGRTLRGLLRVKTSASA